MPEVYRVHFETTKGDFVIEVTRAWAPRGADRFHELVQTKFYDGARFFRVVPRYIVQFGLKGVPAIDRQWSQMSIPDDPVTQNNARGTISVCQGRARHAHVSGLHQPAGQLLRSTSKASRRLEK